MKIGVISDTHGDVKTTTLALDIFREQEVSCILHCGDIGTAEVVRLFRKIPTYFVFGNSDPCTESLRKSIRSVGQNCCEWFGTLELENKRVAFLHGHHNERFDQEVRSGNWDLICFGHSHLADLSLYHETLLLNPGAIFRTPSPSVAVVEIPEMNVHRFAIQK